MRTFIVFSLPGEVVIGEGGQRLQTSDHVAVLKGTDCGSRGCGSRAGEAIMVCLESTLAGGWRCGCAHPEWRNSTAPFMGKVGYSSLLMRGRGQPWHRLRSFLRRHWEVSFEHEAWEGEGLFAGELVCLASEEASSAGAGHGGQEAGGDERGAESDDQVLEEFGTCLDLQELRPESGEASGLFPRGWLSVLLSPAAHLQGSKKSSLKSSLGKNQDRCNNIECTSCVHHSVLAALGGI